MAPPVGKPAAPGGMQVEQGQEYSTANVAVGSPVAVLDYVLRFAALALTLVATIVLGAAKQTTEFTLNGDLVQGTLKAISASAGKFFVAANVIACAYGMASLALSIVSRGASRNVALVVTLVDVVMVALLFAGNGAASAIAVVARKGEGILWDKICGVFNKVCDHMTAAIVLSMFAAIAYLLLVVFSVLHRAR